MAATAGFIYFDLGNVLVNFDHRLGARQMAGVAGISEQRAWDVVFAGDLHLDYERGAITTREFYEAFCARTGTRPDYDRLLLAGADIFWLNDSIVPLVSELRERGHRLGILSNTNESHWNLITDGRFPIVQEYFELYALSFEMRAAKPDLAAYRIAAELARVAAEAVFFIDDRLDNVVGAREAGIDAVQFVGVEALRDELQSRGKLR